MKPSQAMAKWDSHSPGATYEPSESLDCMAKLEINRYSATISAKKIITFLHHYFSHYIRWYKIRSYKKNKIQASPNDRFGLKQKKEAHQLAHKSSHLPDNLFTSLQIIQQNSLI